MYEVPDDISASAVSLSSLTADHLAVHKITKLFTADEMAQAMRKAGEFTYQAHRCSGAQQQYLLLSQQTQFVCAKTGNGMCSDACVDPF